MSRDPDAIQREIERARADLASTLDQLADRYSPKAVAARGKETAVEKAKSPAGLAVGGVLVAGIVLLVVRRIRNR